MSKTSKTSKTTKGAKIPSLALGALSLMAGANYLPEAMAQTPPSIVAHHDAKISVAHHEPKPSVAHHEPKPSVAHHEPKPSVAHHEPKPSVAHHDEPVELVQTRLTDIRGHWAETFIVILNQQGIIAGFPDRTFRPNEPVTRAQFASIINNAFNEPFERQPIRFRDVPSNDWAASQIQRAHLMGFLQGFPDRTFRPNKDILRVNALIALASGLDLRPQGNPSTILSVYRDASSIPSYAINGAAAATENELVVSYPNRNFLYPERQATRAEIAAFVYQALVDAGRLTALNESDRASRYIVGFTVAAKPDERAPVDPKPEPKPATPSRAQLRDLRVRLASLDNTTDLRQIYLSSPAVSGGSPSPFGAYWGTIYTALSYQAETRNNGNDDGAVAFGFGLGDPRYVGLDTTVTSLSTIDSGFFDRVGVSFKLHRAFKGDFGIAAGIENLILSEDSDSTSSGYGVVGKVFKLKPSTRHAFSRLNLSLGVGGGRFRAFDNLDEDTLGVFGSVGLRVFEPVSVFADWTGQDLNAGVSVVPIRNFPLVITPVFQDLTKEANDEVRFSVSVGASYSF